VTPAVLACLPVRLHPVSRMILEAFIDGRITKAGFLWGFHLPNSDYLPVAQCIVHALTLPVGPP
jgi:hypothetical protein